MSRLVLQVTCPDQPGIIARFTGLLFDQGANVLRLEQHVEPEPNLFFMRIVADLGGSRLSSPVLQGRVQALAESLGARTAFRDPDSRARVAVLVSREEACLHDLALGQKSGDLPCALALVISNHDRLRPVAESFQIPFHHFPVDKETKPAQERQVLALLEEQSVDLVVLARYMQVLSADFVRRWEGRIINIHHGFLPAFKGGRPYHQAWERGVKLIGATAHYVTEEVDEGPIISQDTVSVTHQHGAEEMARAGRDIERRVLTAAVKAHLEHRIILHGRRTIIFH